MASILRLIIKIHGQVQGVFFRYSAKEAAEKLNIDGFARNENNDSVYIEAEGEKENLEKFLQWCRQGPSGAKVEKIEFEFNNNIKGFKTFDILSINE